MQNPLLSLYVHSGELSRQSHVKVAVLILAITSFPFGRSAYVFVMTQTPAQATDIPQRPKGKLLYPSCHITQRSSDKDSRNIEDRIPHLASLPTTCIWSHSVPDTRYHQSFVGPRSDTCQYTTECGSSPEQLQPSLLRLASPEHQPWRSSRLCGRATPQVGRSESLPDRAGEELYDEDR